ncbi:MAG TPA: TonB-dependent receptor [Gemmatimonadales bacterium]|nr:TonB-dependent receptor [Gemmatimonadales bacterium]
MRWTLLAPVLLPGLLMAQEGTVEGRVTAAGEPVAGAAVSVAGTTLRGLTAADGQYRIVSVPAGSHVLRVRAVGHTPRDITITIGTIGPIRADVTLEPAPVVLSEMVVSASREAQRKTETAASVGIVDGGAIAASRPHHPGDVVSRVPGAWVANLGGEGHFTAIRQPITTKPVYAFLEDGVPIRSTGFFNHNGLYEINIPQADRVEIIKGPGTAIYGSDAVGGVVNAFTRDPSVRPEASGFVEGGGYGYVRSLLTGSGKFGDAGVRADLNLTRSDGWRNDAPYSRQSSTLRWDQAVSPHSSLKTIVAFSHIDQPSDGGSDLTRADYETGPETNYTPITYRRVWAFRASSAWEHRSDLSLLGATGYVRYNELDLMPSWQLSFDPQIWASKNTSAGLMTRYRRTLPSLKTNVAIGADFEYSPGSRMEQEIVPHRTGDIYDSYSLGHVQYDYDVSFWQATPYAQADINPFDRVHLSAGLRADFVGYDYSNNLSELDTGTHRRPANTDVSFNALSPKLGLTVDVAEGLNVFASYRAAFRVPAESQLFRQGAAENTVDLKPVKADNFEIGARAGLGSVLSVEASAYQLDIEDDILTFFDPTSGLRLASNAGQTKHRGVELGVVVTPVAGVRVDGSWTWARHTYEEWKPSATTDYSGQEIEMAPRQLGRAAVTVSPRFFNGGSMTGEWIHHGGYWQNPENTARYSGHDLGNIFGNFPVGLGLEVSARVNNIFDQRFAETSSYNAFQGERLRPGQPRTVYVGLQYAWKAR